MKYYFIIKNSKIRNSLKFTWSSKQRVEHNEHKFTKPNKELNINLQNHNLHGIQPNTST